MAEMGKLTCICPRCKKEFFSNESRRDCPGCGFRGVHCALKREHVPAASVKEAASGSGQPAQFTEFKIVT